MWFYIKRKGGLSTPLSCAELRLALLCALFLGGLFLCSFFLSGLFLCGLFLSGLLLGSFLLRCLLLRHSSSLECGCSAWLTAPSYHKGWAEPTTLIPDVDYG